MVVSVRREQMGADAGFVHRRMFEVVVVVEELHEVVRHHFHVGHAHPDLAPQGDLGLQL